MLRLIDKIPNAKKTNAGYFSDFLQSKNMKLENMRGQGFDGTNTMSGCSKAFEILITKCPVYPLLILSVYPFIQLQLAAISAANDHTEVQRVLGTLLTI